MSFGARDRMGEACFYGEKTGTKDEAVWAATLKVLDPVNGSFQQGAVRKAAVKHVS